MLSGASQQHAAFYSQALDTHDIIKLAIKVIVVCKQGHDVFTWGQAE